MGTNHMGRQSIRFPQPPVVRGFASVAGKKEREGPLGDQFTATVQDTTFGEKSWEQAERRMQQMTLELALEKAGLTDADLDAAFAGDLLNQCIGSSFSLRNRGVPTLGLTVLARRWRSPCCLRLCPSAGASRARRWP